MISKNKNIAKKVMDKKSKPQKKIKLSKQEIFIGGGYLDDDDDDEDKSQQIRQKTALLRDIQQNSEIEKKANEEKIKKDNEFKQWYKSYRLNMATTTSDGFKYTLHNETNKDDYKLKPNIVTDKNVLKEDDNEAKKSLLTEKLQERKKFIIEKTKAFRDQSLIPELEGAKKDVVAKIVAKTKKRKDEIEKKANEIKTMLDSAKLNINIKLSEIDLQISGYGININVEDGTYSLDEYSVDQLKNRHMYYVILSEINNFNMDRKLMMDSINTINDFVNGEHEYSENLTEAISLINSELKYLEDFKVNVIISNIKKTWAKIHGRELIEAEEEEGAEEGAEGVEEEVKGAEEEVKGAEEEVKGAEEETIDAEEEAVDAEEEAVKGTEKKQTYEDIKQILSNIKNKPLQDLNMYKYIKETANIKEIRGEYKSIFRIFDTKQETNIIFFNKKLNKVSIKNEFIEEFKTHNDENDEIKKNIKKINDTLIKLSTIINTFITDTTRKKDNQNKKSFNVLKDQLIIQFKRIKDIINDLYIEIYEAYNLTKESNGVTDENFPEATGFRGGNPIKYKSTGQIVYIMYKKRKYKRVIYVKDKRNTKYCKINYEYILLSKLKVIEQ